VRPHLRRISRLTPRPDSTQSGQRVRTFPVLAGTDSSNLVCSIAESTASLSFLDQTGKVLKTELLRLLAHNSS